jgi:hypothetical protein
VKVALQTGVLVALGWFFVAAGAFEFGAPMNIAAVFSAVFFAVVLLAFWFTRPTRGS